MEISSALIKTVIKNRSIYSEFQPVVSVNTRRVVGVEALSRGRFQEEIISPYTLFEYAKDLDKTVELDHLCRLKALEVFSAGPQTPMLFLNFEADILNQLESESEMFLSSVRQFNVPHENIVIEINEKYVSDNNKLIRFVEFYREQGFMIALDDVGAGHSNLNRITVVRPDVVKIDMALVRNIDKSPYCQEVFKSIINLAKKIGAFTVAEGAETAEEVAACTLCGVDFIQGFYFARPTSLEQVNALELSQPLEDVSRQINAVVKQNQEIDLDRKKNYLSVMNQLLEHLQPLPSLQYEDAMWRFVSDNSDVECVFLLDIHGVQISDTIILEDSLHDRRSAFFAPAVKGDRHEIKNYYYAVKENIENPFISDWYISNATGRSCKTVSSKFLDEQGNTVIVCVDIKYDKNRYQNEPIAAKSE